jgi:hypothetical protein
MFTLFYFAVVGNMFGGLPAMAIPNKVSFAELENNYLKYYQGTVP